MLDSLNGQRVLMIDPSLSATGMAIFDPATVGHRLSLAQLVRGPARIDALADRCAAVVYGIVAFTPGVVSHVIIERPRVHVATHGSKADPDDLIKLAVLCGAIAQAFVTRGATVRFIKPDSWKKQMTKEVTTARAVARLGDDEMARVQLPSAQSLQHNVWDAVGIGLWAVGRW